MTIYRIRPVLLEDCSNNVDIRFVLERQVGSFLFFTTWRQIGDLHPSEASARAALDQDDMIRREFHSRGPDTYINTFTEENQR